MNLSQDDSRIVRYLVARLPISHSIRTLKPPNLTDELLQPFVL
jgi:hypothetical protein